MVFKSILGATCACLAVVSFNATAIPIEADWKNVGDGLITYDANTGLEWLDLTETANMSFNDVSAQLGEGGLFEGWQYATIPEVGTFWTNFGVENIGEGSGSAANAAAWDLMAPLLGDLFCEFNMCNAGDGYSNMFIDHHLDSLVIIAGMFSDGIFHFEQRSLPEEFHPYKGSALIRRVPEPSIAVLLASGLMVFGAVRRKET